MFWFIVTVVLLLTGLVLLVARPKIEDDAGEVFHVGAIAGAVLAFTGVGILALTMTYTVQAKQVGVITTFGKVSPDTASPGLHLKKPWDKVTEVDTTIQTDEYHGKSGIQVRMKDGNTATVSTTVRWSVAPENANEVYADFRNSEKEITDAFRSAVVATQFKAANNAAFASFDPLTLAGITGEAPDYGALEKTITEDLQERSKGLVDTSTISVTISLVTLDKDSQRSVDQYVKEVNKTRVAEQAQKTAAEQAKANEILSDSISKDPNVLVARCLDLIESGDLKPPAGFSCWQGGGSGVVIPGGR